MKKLMIGLAAILGSQVAVSAGIDAYVTEEGGRKIVTIPQGVTYTMKSEDVTSIDNADIVKLGEGMLVTAAEMAAYTGNIYISNGVWKAAANTALGTSAGKTYADGGTLLNEVSSGNTSGGACSLPNEEIHIKGTGYNNQGALATSAYTVDICRKVTMDGDARIVVAADKRMDFRFTNFTMNGYHLTTRGDFRFVALTINSPGDVTAEPTYLELQGSSSIDASSANRTITITTGTRLGFWDSTCWYRPKFVFEDGTRISADSGKYKYVGTDNRNVLSGVKVFQGSVTNNVGRDVQVQLRGYSTGPGGIVPGETRGGWLQFADGMDTMDASTNDFRGGVAVQGIATNSDFIGGLVLYRNGAIPADANAGPITLDNAQLHARTITSLDLPGVVVKGGAVVTNDGKLATCNVKSLVKSGNGILHVYGPMHVQGDVEIQGGTLRCGTRVPSVYPGMHWAHNTTGAITELNEANLIKRSDYQGVDKTGLYYAYNDWPTARNEQFDYIGYFKVPDNNEGADVRCRFIADVWRYVKIWVDGTKVLQIDDNKVTVPANSCSDLGWKRHYWSDSMLFCPGWHKIVVSMSGNSGNYDNGVNHSCESADYGLWPKRFGVGVDFNASTTLAKDWKTSSETMDSITNAAHYVKLKDPGDGSFIRATTNENIKTCEDGTFKVENFRPTFDGNVCFAGGTVLDLNDTEPYTVMTMPSLTGLPTIRSGAVNVTSTTWTIRADDLAANVPLTVESDAQLTFGGAKTVTIDGDPTTFASLRRMGAGKAIFASANLASYTFTLSQRMQDIGYVLETRDGALYLKRDRGMVLIFK